MTTYYLNNVEITEGSAFTVGDFTYPYSWLAGASDNVRNSMGITKVSDVNYDPKYYWAADNAKALDDKEEVDQEGNPMFVKVLGKVNGQDVMVDSAKRLVSRGLKTNCTNEIKTLAGSMIAPTDFYIIRNEVESVAIPQEVVAKRAHIVSEQDRLVSAIAAVETVDSLIEVMNSASWEVPVVEEVEHLPGEVTPQ